jgi:hypothetical protein
MRLFLNDCTMYVTDLQDARRLLRGNGNTEEQDCLVRLADAYELWDLLPNPGAAGPVMWTLVSKGTKVRGEKGWDVEVAPLSGVSELEGVSGWEVAAVPEGVTAEGQPHEPGGPHYPASVYLLPEFDRAHVQQVLAKYTEVLLKSIAESFAAIAESGGSVTVWDGERGFTVEPAP